MPFTPFHFGPGLFLKSIAADHYSFTAFVATQVAIDCETLYYLTRDEYPFHRALHTFAGATAMGLLVAVLLLVVARGAFKVIPQSEQWLSSRSMFRSEFTFGGLVVGGLAGGLTHPLLDGLMHADVRPLLPWSTLNPLLRIGSAEALHLICMSLGLVAVMVIILRRALMKVRNRPSG